MKKISVYSLIPLVVLMLFTISLAIMLFADGDEARDDVSRDALEEEVSDSTLNFLFTGKDSEAGLADVIILASINMETGDTTVLQIPRDTYFAYTDGDYKKINGAQRAIGSVSGFAGALSDALGVRIDHYLSLDLGTLSDMVDAVSGVEIDIPCDMDYDDPEQGLSIHLKAGKQTLDGRAAVQFVRYRAGYITGDIGRMDAQKLFLNAFSDKLKSSGNPIMLYKLFKLVTSRADTDISEQEMIELALEGIRKRGSISYVTLPGEAVRSERSGAWYYILSRRSTAELLAERFGREGEEKDFDKSNKFVDKTQKSFYDIYNSPREYIIYSGDEVENNLTNIN